MFERHTSSPRKGTDSEIEKRYSEPKSCISRLDLTTDSVREVGLLPLCICTSDRGSFVTMS
jgi:hypothetical protein